MLIAAGSSAQASLRRTPETAARPWRAALLTVAIGVIALIGAQHHTVAGLTSAWSASVTYAFAWVVLPTFVLSLWLDRRRFAVDCPEGAALGVAAALLALAAGIAADVLNITELRHWALLASLLAIILAGVGLRLFGRLGPYLALLFFLIPTGRILIDPLKDLTAAVIAGFATVAAIPMLQDGAAIYIAGQRYVVIDDCAGLPFVLIGSFLGLTFGLQLFRRWWKIAALALIGGACGVVANAVRVIAIVAVDYHTGTQMDLADHMPFQWAGFSLIFLALIVLAANLRGEAPAAPVPADRKQSPAAVRKIVVCTLLAAAIGALPALVPARTAAGHDDRPATALVLPASLAGWIREAGEPDWAPTVIGVTRSAVAAYRRDHLTISVFVAEAGTVDEKVSGGAVQLIDDLRWMPAWSRIVEVCGEQGCIPVRHAKLVKQKTKRVRHLYSVVEVGPRLTVSVLETRLQRGLSRLTGAPARARLLAVLHEHPDGLAGSELAALILGLRESGATRPATPK